jgi:hypothetical protein
MDCKNCQGLNFVKVSARSKLPDARGFTGREEDGIAIKGVIFVLSG